MPLTENEAPRTDVNPNVVNHGMKNEHTPAMDVATRQVRSAPPCAGAALAAISGVAGRAVAPGWGEGDGPGPAAAAAATTGAPESCASAVLAPAGTGAGFSPAVSPQTAQTVAPGASGWPSAMQ